MMEAVHAALEMEGSKVRVGRVDVSSNNGIGRTLGLQRFPTVLLVDAKAELYYEFMGRRGLKELIEWSRGGYREGGGVVLPLVLHANVSESWLMLESLWRPAKTALTWALGIALGIKGLAKCLLSLTERGMERERRRRRREKSKAGGGGGGGGDGGDDESDDDESDDESDDEEEEEEGDGDDAARRKKKD